MPVYDFKNKETGEVIENVRFQSWRNKDEYLKENPHLELVYNFAPQVNADPIGSNRHRKGFREVLNKIHTRTAGSTMNKTTEI